MPRLENWDQSKSCDSIHKSGEMITNNNEDLKIYLAKIGIYSKNHKVGLICPKICGIPYAPNYMYVYIYIHMYINNLCVCMCVYVHASV